ncbi:hypothetical protein CWI37_1070p0010 [Hamiltosporidium tvaerminnensis]|uniref:Uncharacterized protein n=2 Tax=Hamiltosporidium TaxID=1176354 RepID=A0A4Q9L6L2_9MICR|nr:hypothetical protein LUQ84_001509 [Hamiltosporidium tvaerminnensis]TBU00234.1 hypothetical protein CWI37_1070p0010 [Hamiltosporidium tvaerminnensis]TBU02731.1 hypothetical protein CWI36_1054p0010 [Hamiltosporidium magnivora]TBU03263.1 hypothetical protein CWI36_0955p0030 [Hamiltosporidium magnivora]
MFSFYVCPVLKFIFSFVRSSKRGDELENDQSILLGSESVCHLQDTVSLVRDNSMNKKKFHFRRKKRVKRKRSLSKSDLNFTDEETSLNGKISDIISIINDIRKEIKDGSDIKSLLIKLQELITSIFGCREGFIDKKINLNIICLDLQKSIEDHNKKLNTIETDCKAIYEKIRIINAKIYENNLKNEQELIELLQKFLGYTNKMILVFEKLQNCFAEYRMIKKSITITESFKNVQNDQ